MLMRFGHGALHVETVSLLWVDASLILGSTAKAEAKCRPRHYYLISKAAEALDSQVVLESDTYLWGRV